MTTRNERAQLNTIHIPINFQTSETIANEKMAQIAKEYMAGIGLDDQPYLVYRHNDAHYPHCHVICPKIDEDGKRLS
ncbi:relaxase/mobilization nuclease domain-containing protein [Puia sp. P3]|uniref:relaxase/mobilization nuclease domain-containing protein n=1 Tax=Puia sp. P3 TaxID=3423952 RepID=UPI003D675C43